VFAFYQFNRPPMFFNQYEVKQVQKSEYATQYNELESEYTKAFEQRKATANDLVNAIDSKDDKRIEQAKLKLQETEGAVSKIRQDGMAIMKKNNAQADTNDTNYVFLNFVTHYLPKGLIGLLIAIVFMASMGSTASALNSLASTTVIDIYKRGINKTASDQNYLNASRAATVFWGLVCIVMALYASKLGNLLEAVNQLGSYIYGTILGVFVTAFYLKKIKGTAVFIAAVLSEIIICICGYYEVVAYLWLNAIGCILVILLAVIANQLVADNKAPQSA